MVKERIANIGKLRPLSFLERFDNFLRFSNFLGSLVFAYQPTVHSCGVSQGEGLWLLA